MKLKQLEKALSRFNRADGRKRFGYRITSLPDGTILSLKMVVHDNPADFTEETVLPVDAKGMDGGDFEAELDKVTNPVAKVLIDRAKIESSI